MLFQVYGEGAGWQLLGWLLVFTTLVLANEVARRSKKRGRVLLFDSARRIDDIFYCHPHLRWYGYGVGTE